MSSPIGWLRLRASNTALIAIDFVDAPHPSENNNDAHPILQAARQQLLEYFSGTRQHFTLPLAPQGTDFQNSVWQALTNIAYGQTCSYLNIATAIGNPKAMRAVGAANGRNPIPIIIPCHRVIGRDGRLVGFSGGLDKKEWLLNHEGAAFI